MLDAKKLEDGMYGFHEKFHDHWELITDKRPLCLVDAEKLLPDFDRRLTSLLLNLTFLFSLELFLFLALNGKHPLCKQFLVWESILFSLCSLLSTVLPFDSGISLDRVTTVFLIDSQPTSHTDKSLV